MEYCVAMRTLQAVADSDPGLDARHSESLRVVGGYDDMDAFGGERLRNAGPIPMLPAVMTAILSLNPRSMAFRSVESI